MNHFQAGSSAAPLSAPMLGPAVRAQDRSATLSEGALPEPLAPFFRGRLEEAEVRSESSIRASAPEAQSGEELPWLLPQEGSATAGPSPVGLEVADGPNAPAQEPGFLEDLPSLSLEGEVVAIESLAPDAAPASEVVPIESLAPDADAEPEVVPITALAPEPEPEPEVESEPWVEPGPEPAAELTETPRELGLTALPWDSAADREVEPEEAPEPWVDAAPDAEPEEELPSLAAPEPAEPEIVPEPTMPAVAEPLAPPAPAGALEGLAERLEQIARSLRGRSGAEVLGGTGDPLEALIAGYAMGYAEAQRRMRAGARPDA